MSKLSDQAQAFIEHLGGSKEAAQFFGKSEQTVKLWLKTGNYPQVVHEAVSDSLIEEFVPLDSGEIRTATQERVEPPAQPVPPQSAQAAEPTIKDLIEHINQLYAIVVPLAQNKAQPQQQQQNRRINIPRGQMPSIVAQESSLPSMVGGIQGFSHTNARADTVEDGSVIPEGASPVYAEPRNPDPKHWTKPMAPKFVFKEAVRR